MLYIIMAVIKTISVSDDVYAELLKESKEKTRKISQLINHHLRSWYSNKPTFFECRLCGEKKAPEPNGLCPECFRIKQEQLRQDYEEKLKSIANREREEQEQKEREQKEQEETEKKRKIRERIDFLENAIFRCRKEQKLLSDDDEERYNALQERINKMEAELDELKTKFLENSIIN